MANSGEGEMGRGEDAIDSGEGNVTRHNRNAWSRVS